MSLMTAATEEHLQPEIVAFAIPPLDANGVRCLPSCMRIRRVGAAYFVEQLHLKRTMTPKGVEYVEDDWKGIAIAKGKDARSEAFDWMHSAHAKFVASSH